MSKREFIHGFQKLQHAFRLPHQEGRLTHAFASPKREILLFKTLVSQVSSGFKNRNPFSSQVTGAYGSSNALMATLEGGAFWSRPLYHIPNKQTQVQKGAATCSRSLYDIGKARSLWSGSLADARPLTLMKVFWTSPLPSLQSSPDFFSFI